MATEVYNCILMPDISMYDDLPRNLRKAVLNVLKKRYVGKYGGNPQKREWLQLQIDKMYKEVL